MKLRQIAVIAIIALLAVVLYAQLVDNAPRNIYHSASAPATCNFGDVWFKSGAPAGQNLYGCTATNVWTLLSGGTSGPQGATGPAGPSGGPSGPQGGSGVSGAGGAGASGASGAIGFGASGASGAGGMGASGASGAGGTGASGASGRGASGAQGLGGLSGPAGSSGASGVGASGASGVPGSASASGASGPAGGSGASGAGTPGASGVAGSAGSSGPAGSAGASGVSGPGGGFYQTVKSNGTSETQRAALNFSTNFILTDSASPSQTNIGMLTPTFQTVTLNPLTGNQGLTMLQPSGAASNAWSGGTGYAFNSLVIGGGSNTGDTTNANGQATAILALYEDFGGSYYTGGTAGISATIALDRGATNSGNTNRNYTGSVSVALAMNGDGGTPITPQGGIFGGNDVVAACGGEGDYCPNTVGAAPYLYNVTGREIDISLQTGSSSHFVQGLAIVNSSYLQGDALDTAIDISGGRGAFGFRTGISFDATHSGNPLNSNATMIASVGSATVTNGIDISSYTFTGYAIHTPGFTVDGSANIVFSGTLTTGASSGVACSGLPTVSFATVNGIVTHC